MTGRVEHGNNQPKVINRNEFVGPTYPDAALDDMRVKLPDGFRAPDSRNPFVVVMERASTWLEQADDKGHKLTPEKLVRLAQYATGTMLNDDGLKNLRGLARDTIDPPYDRLEETKNAMSFKK